MTKQANTASLAHLLEEVHPSSNADDLGYLGQQAVAEAVDTLPELADLHTLLEIGEASGPHHLDQSRMAALFVKHVAKP